MKKDDQLQLLRIRTASRRAEEQDILRFIKNNPEKFQVGDTLKLRRTRAKISTLSTPPKPPEPPVSSIPTNFFSSIFIFLKNIFLAFFFPPPSENSAAQAASQSVDSDREGDYYYERNGVRVEPESASSSITQQSGDDKGFPASLLSSYIVEIDEARSNVDLIWMGDNDPIGEGGFAKVKGASSRTYNIDSMQPVGDESRKAIKIQTKTQEQLKKEGNVYTQAMPGTRQMLAPSKDGGGSNKQRTVGERYEKTLFSASQELKHEKSDANIKFSKVLGWYNQLLEQVSELHKSGHNHCDIKPANVMLDGVGSVHLIDYEPSDRTLRSKNHAGSPGFGTADFLPHKQPVLGATELDNKFKQNDIDSHSCRVLLQECLNKAGLKWNRGSSDLNDVNEEIYKSICLDKNHVYDTSWQGRKIGILTMDDQKLKIAAAKGGVVKGSENNRHQRKPTKDKQRHRRLFLKRNSQNQRGKLSSQRSKNLNKHKSSAEGKPSCENSPAGFSGVLESSVKSLKKPRFPPFIRSCFGSSPNV